ncbi:unnamed protein product, partial [marine sediment metagenome]
MKVSSVEKNMNRLGAGLALGGQFQFECYDKLGDLKWSGITNNLVVNEGLDDILNKTFDYHTAASWYVGLIATNPVVKAADTLASHASWTDAAGYTGDRKAYTVVTTSGQAVTNTAAKATFVFDSVATITGAYISTASSGTSGVLFSGATFTAK